MKKIKVAILGCSGLVGQQFARLLDDHPYFETSCLTASSRSAGKKYGETLDQVPATWVSAGVRDKVIRATTPEDIISSGAQVVFSALPAGSANELELALRRQGLFVFPTPARTAWTPMCHCSSRKRTPITWRWRKSSCKNSPALSSPIPTAR